MKAKLSILVLALSVIACDDEAARELEILSRGAPSNDVERVEIAYARARQVDAHMNPIDRALFEGTPEAGSIERERAALDALLAETAGASSPGALDDATRAGAFTPAGEFRGSRTRLHMATSSLERASEAAFSERDRARRMWIPVGATAAGLPLLGVFALMVLRLGKRRPAAR